MMIITLELQQVSAGTRSTQHISSSWKEDLAYFKHVFIIAMTIWQYLIVHLDSGDLQMLKTTEKRGLHFKMLTLAF